MMDRILSISEELILRSFDESVSVRHLDLSQRVDGGNYLQQVADRFRELERSLKASEVDLVVLEAMGARNRGRSIKKLAKVVYMDRFARKVVLSCRKAGIPLVVHDRIDHLTLSPLNRFLLRHADLYFKRELAFDPWRCLETVSKLRPPCHELRKKQVEVFDVSKFRPISLGLGLTQDAVMENAPPLKAWHERSIDCLVALGKTDFKPVREQLALIDFSDPRFSGLNIRVLNQPVPHDEFLQLLGDSKTCLSPPGFGWDCYRHYESLFSGALPVLTRPDIRTPLPWKDTANCLILESSFSGEEFARTLRRIPALGDPDCDYLREQVLENHSQDAHLGRILSEVKALTSCSRERKS